MWKKIIFLSLVSSFCYSDIFALAPPKFNAQSYVSALKKTTDVMLNDVASPVAASRYYAYITISSYETISLFDSSHFASLKGVIRLFPGLVIEKKLFEHADPHLAIVLAVFKSGQKLLPSGFMLQKEIDSLALMYGSTEKSKSVFQQTSTLVDEIVKQIVDYAKKDGFPKLNNLSRYTPKPGDAFWKPTPPVFMAPVEPHWNTLRTYLLDSAQQFKTPIPVTYDTSVSSPFYKMVKEVYETDKNATEEQRNVANFWDCNPFAVQQIGHVEFGLKKISPGGHWIGIAGIACIKKKKSLEETAMVHMLLSVTLADAFIACWDEKYRSNRVRPETVIQKLIDPRWHPMLQTPPFPEYVSGHSVASNAAAVMLTSLFGDGFHYTDNTEVEFGLPERKFISFYQAAAEAAISRLYGGIHYMDAIEAGKVQGKQVGSHAVHVMQTHIKQLQQK
jgi:hypothetical protein